MSNLARRDVVVLYRDGRLLVEDGGLPALTTATSPAPGSVWGGLPAYADILARVGGGFLAGPARRLAADLTMHLVVPDPSRDSTDPPVPGTGWRDAAEVPGLVPDPRVRDAVLQALVEHTEVVPVPEHRPPWFRRGWPGPVLGWLAEALAAAGRPATGPVEVVRMWSLSAVLRVPTTRGPAYLKATNQHFHAEAAITRVLAAVVPDLAPPLIAEDDARAWLLLDDLPGVDDRRAAGAGLVAAPRLADLQLRSLDHLDSLAAAGCPRRTGPETLAGLAQVLEGSVELDQVEPAQVEAARAAAPRLQELVEELWACGLPATLCHGDLHLGNVAYDGTGLRLFDWTDASLGHPFLDAVHLARSAAGEAAQPGDDPGVDPDVLTAYARPWREAFPGADVDRALRLAPAVDRVFQAISYEAIQRSTEPVSRWELAGQVAGFLRAAPSLLDGA